LTQVGRAINRTEPDRRARGPQLSVLMPVRNEELNVRAALESVTWADEIWVVDSHSTDKTLSIASEYTDKIIQFDYPGHPPKKKNWSLDNLQFRNEWVLILDADERVTPTLAQEIAAVIKKPLPVGYYLDRDYVFLGRSLRSFRPNWNLRLFKHRLGRYEELATEVPATGDNEAHEHVVLDGAAGFLRNPLLHEDKRPLRAWIDNHNRYSEWEAEVYRQLRREPLDLRGLLGRGPEWRHNQLKKLWVRMPFRPWARFLAFYVLKRGFLDGTEGFLYSVLMAYYEFLIGLKLREASRAEATARACRTEQDNVSAAVEPGRS
jgi:glycosyltransferase involved in cell wall biosynthesis